MITESNAAPPPTAVSFREALRVWTKIGVLSFGGPAGQIAIRAALLQPLMYLLGSRIFSKFAHLSD